MMKKVLFVIDSLDCGGAERSLVSLLPLLDYSHYNVDLIMVRRGGIFEQYVPKEVNVVPLPARKRFIGVLCQLYFSLLLRVLKITQIKRHGAETHWVANQYAYSELKMRGEYDVAIAYQQGFPTYYVATKVSATKKIAWINVDLQKAGYREKFNRKFYDKMNCCVAVSDGLAEMLQNSSYVEANKLQVLYDIVNVELIRKMATENGFDNKLPKNMFCIVTVGRMTPPKNYPLAVETAYLLKRKGLSFQWYFIGDGSERPYVEDMVTKLGLENEIYFLGMRPNPYPYIMEADIYVQTSSFEGYCLTLCEARILHKPVVSTNFPVVYNQIRDGENGFIAEMNAESLAEKMLMLTQDDNLRDRIIENTRKEVNETMVTEIAKFNALLTA